MNNVIKADEVVKTITAKLVTPKPLSNNLDIVETVKKVLEYAEQLDMSVVSTFCGDDFTSVTGIKDGCEVSIMCYKGARKNA